VVVNQRRYETLEELWRSSRVAFARAVNTRLSCTESASDGAASVTTTSVRGGADARAFEPVPSQAAPSATVLTSAIQTPLLRSGMVRIDRRAGTGNRIRR
jgi:hypothetical protein